MELNLDTPARLLHPLITRTIEPTIGDALKLCSILGLEGIVSIWDGDNFHRCADEIEALATEVGFVWPSKVHAAALP